ncbi:MAG TPA: glycosyltransferase [bacterium]|nr:glycosyltransferase [bacterium]
MGEPVNVLMLNYEYPPLGGGAGNATAYLLRELTNLDDVSVTLVTSSTTSERVERISDRIWIHFLDIGKRGNPHYQSNRDLLTYSWQSLRHCRGLIRSNAYNLCHAFFGIPSGVITRMLGLPYIVSLRGSDVPFYNERFRIPDLLLFRRLSVRVWRDAARVVANSQQLRSLALQSSPQQKIEVIPNGVDVAEFQPAPCPLDPTEMRILCVSRLIARKRIDVLIKSLAIVRDLPVSLTLVGTGNEESQLRQMVKELNLGQIVRFEGYVSHDCIAKVYQQSNLFVLPSANEGMSNTVLEAMACGLPILMRQTGGTEELIQDGSNGFVLHSGSSDEIAGRIRLYCERPEMLSIHGKASRKIAESLSWRNVAQDYHQLYLTIAERRLSLRNSRVLESGRQGR